MAQKDPPGTSPDFSELRKKTDGEKISNKFNNLRKRSEFFYKLDPVNPGKTSPKEAKNLIEELRIHQIELEMQNDELQLAQSQLIAARDKYEDLYDSAPVSYLTIERKGLILDTNLTFCRLVNLERNKIINHRFTDFIAEEDQDTYYLHYQKVQDSGCSQTCELELKKQDGTRFYARLDSIIDKRWAEEDNQIKTVITDITKFKKLEAQLRQSQKMEALGTLAGGIAHEFNNSLHIIGLNLDYLKSKIPTENPLWKNIESSQKTCTRAVGIIRQILSYSHMDKKQIEAIDVIPVIEDCVKLVQSTLPPMIKTQVNIKVEKAVIQVEESQIQQIIFNFCSNAGYAMGETGGNLEIIVDTIVTDTDFSSYHQVEEGPFLQITIVDDGIGIEKTDLGRIFDPFFTTKPVGEGTGMGLSVVHGIVRSLGGTITVLSTIGKGTIFKVFFPVLEEVATIPSNAIRQVIGGNEHILIVDDEEGIIDIHTEILEDLGYNVTAVTSSMEALELFRSKPKSFDMVLTDHGMSEMTGIQLAKEILLIRNDIPISLLTGYDDKTLEEDAKQNGISRIILKPLDHEVLGEIVREVLNESNKAV